MPKKEKSEFAKVEYNKFSVAMKEHLYQRKKKSEFAKVENPFIAGTSKLFNFRIKLSFSYRISTRSSEISIRRFDYVYTIPELCPEY